MEPAEHSVANGVECRHALLIVSRLPRPARGAVEPSRDFFLNAADEIARGPQVVVLISPRIREAAAKGLHSQIVLGPDSIAIGKSKTSLPRAQEAIHRVA